VLINVKLLVINILQKFLENFENNSI